MQEKRLIGEIVVPVIRENDITYYPISFIMEKILLKKTRVATLQKEYSQYISKHRIDYGIDTGGIQNVNCITEYGLKEVLGNSKIGRLSVEQKVAMNILLEFLHMDVISEDDRFIKKVSDDVIQEYNEYIRDCIEFVLKDDHDIVWQKCTKCGNYYPYHENFFGVNDHSGKEYPLYTICRNCIGKDNIKSENKDLKLIYNKYNENTYKTYRDHNVLGIYNHWIANTNTKTMPKVINNESDKLVIIKECYNKGMFSGYPDMTSSVIHKVCKFRVDGSGFIQRINKELFGVVMRHGKEYIDNIDDAKLVFNNYIDKHNIIISNIYKFKYDQLLMDANLSGFLRRYNNNLLGYIMELYNNKYPAYKFNINGGIKYWGIKENRVRALRFLIEEDMKIELEKVPLYITLTVLRDKGTATMYGVCKKYYSNLFEWVNEVYPDRFNQMDFDIHYVRNNFDSIEEAEVHDILKREFKSVIYNPSNTDRTIKIDGKVPDWFIFTNNKCYIVEYFGLFINRDTDNSRTNDYKERMDNKIEKYNMLDGYGKLYLFPDDLKDNFKGLMEKLKSIV